jgi:beta-aspartyl-peptidase (threonine type)
MITMIIHGGAGAMRRESLPEGHEQACHAALAHALRVAGRLLADGGHSLDAAGLAVRELEDCPLFNAGRGSCFTAAGTIEMDAAIMDGATLRAGAVAAVRHVRNPITLARLIMEDGRHLLLCGEGAEAFARERGVPVAEAAYFHTQQRWQALLQQRAGEAASGLGEGLSPDGRLEPPAAPAAFGTVGAVALDCRGNLAAATSTGGMNAKHPGRVGDSALIGAGTYADNASCAVSATGHGEHFIRAVAAHTISSLMRFAGASLAMAAETVVNRHLAVLGGRGGVIALNRQGDMAMPFNTEGMYRGWLAADGAIHTAIFREPARVH